MRRSRITLLAMLTALLAPVSLSAQQQQLPPEAQQLMVELQQIQTQLQPVQQQVMQDPAIQQAQQAIGQRMQTAMLEADPTLPQHMTRLQELQGEAQAAQSAQDQERMAAIVAEARQLEMRIQGVQRQVMQQPEMEAELNSFQSTLEEKMLAADPEVAPLIDRYKEINEELIRMLGGPDAD